MDGLRMLSHPSWMKSARSGMAGGHDASKCPRRAPPARSGLRAGHTPQVARLSADQRLASRHGQPHLFGLPPQGRPPIAESRCLQCLDEPAQRRYKPPLMSQQFPARDRPLALVMRMRAAPPSQRTLHRFLACNSCAGRAVVDAHRDVLTHCGLHIIDPSGEAHRAAATGGQTPPARRSCAGGHAET